MAGGIRIGLRADGEEEGLVGPGKECLRPGSEEERGGERERERHKGSGM